MKLHDLSKNEPQHQDGCKPQQNPREIDFLGILFIVHIISLCHIAGALLGNSVADDEYQDGYRKQCEGNAGAKRPIEHT